MWKSDEPSATCRKKLKMLDKILTSVARKRSFPKGCNWVPSCSGEVESNSCLEQMDNIMGNISKSSIKLVPGLMEKTFALRRSYINTCPPVSSILNKYLALKLEEVVHQEMDLIMNMKNVRNIFTNNLVKHTSAIVNLASDRKKASSHITKQLKEMEDDT